MTEQLKCDIIEKYLEKGYRLMNNYAMIAESVRRDSGIIQNNTQKAEFAKTWIGRKKYQIASAKEKKDYLKWSQML